MILILTSSPCIPGNSHINPDNWFIAALHKFVPRGARYLFVSAAPDDEKLSEWSAWSMKMSLESCGLEFSSGMLLDSRTADRAEALVKNSDFIVMGGGHVPTQHHFFEQIGLRELLKDYPGVVMGISAGSMNCAEMVYLQPEERGEGIDPDFIRFKRGLGLTTLNMLPHYQEVKDRILDGLRLYEDITFSDSYGHSFYVFVDGSYYVRVDGIEYICGDCWCIQDGQMHKICNVGERIQL